MRTDASEAAERSLRASCGNRLRRGFSLAPLTTFRIGGPAALYLEPEDDRDLEAIARAVRETGVEVVVLGKGSNVLISDDGYPGLVVRLGRGFRWAGRDGERLMAGGAMPLPALAGIALRHGLDGLAFGVAIPASLGGAVQMNAGAHGSEMSDVVVAVELFDLGAGERRDVDGASLGWGYRRSGLDAGSVVIGATFQLRSRDPAEIRRAMHEAREWRRMTQPLAEPNCGSVFRNPPGGHAARLIEDAGLKGSRVGGASVSTKHANFIVVDPGASASDVRKLIGLVRETVRSSTGVDLEPEVRFIGGTP